MFVSSCAPMLQLIELKELEACLIDQVGVQMFSLPIANYTSHYTWGICPRPPSLRKHYPSCRSSLNPAMCVT